MKIINKYQLQIDMKKYLAIAFYKKIERRGFFVKSHGLELKEGNMSVSYIIGE